MGLAIRKGEEVTLNVDGNNKQEAIVTQVESFLEPFIVEGKDVIFNPF